jgi:ferritin-like metal-binding protein YciE
MHLTNYLRMQSRAEESLADAFRQLGDEHTADAEVYYLVRLFADQCEQHVAKLQPVIEQHGEASEQEPERMHLPGFDGVRSGRAGLLRDLQEIYTSITFVDITWTILAQGAQGARDKQLLEVVSGSRSETEQQLKAIQTIIKSTAPQALLVAP